MSEDAVQAPPRRRPPAFVNRIISGLLRSPLHGLLSKNLMLLSFTGRKSGKQITTPVTYSWSGEQLLFFTATPWWKNLRGGAPVTMRLQGRDRHGTATPADDRAAVLRETRAYLAKMGVKNARLIGLQIDTSREPTDAELDAATRGRVAIYVTLDK